MSPTIDERVVEMRFDSKQFQSEAKSTLGVLDRLKAALKFTDVGNDLEKINRSVNDIRLDGISAGVDTLTKRFSTFGIVGMQIIQNVTSSLMNKLGSAVHYVTDAIVSGGIKRAMNIENAHFQLQALLKDETKVQEVMANAMESVDGTAYAYDEAAKAASMFAASGIQAGDDMLNALKGITGVAAMTNSEFEAISMIFTTVAGNGRLMGDQLLQLSSRGLNAASTITDYMKKVKKQANITETDVRDMVSKGEISFKTFSDAMNWAFGDSAKRANETFTGAMSNMRSALARIGAEFVSPLVEQNGVMVDMFNALRIKINDVKTALTFNKETSAVSGFTKVLGMTAKEAQHFYNVVEKQGKMTIDNIMEIKDHGKNGYSELKKYFNGINDGSIRASYSITQTVKSLTEGNEVTKKDIRKFVKQGKIDFDIFSAAYENAFGTEHQKLSKQFTDTVIKVVDEIRNRLESFDVTQVTSLFYKGFETLKNVLKGVWSILEPIGTAFADVFLNFKYSDVSKLASSIESFSEKLRLSDESAENLRKTFTGVFDILALVGDMILDVIGAFLPFTSTVGVGTDSLLGFTGSIGELLSEFSKTVRSSKKVKAAFESFSKTVGSISRWLSEAIKGIGPFIEKVWEMEETQKVVKTINDIFVDFGKTIEAISIDISNALSSLMKSFSNIDFSTPEKGLNGVGKSFKNLWDTLMKNEGIAIFIENFEEFLREIGDALSKDSIEAKIDGLGNAFSKLFDILKSVGKFLKDTFSPLLEELSLGSVLSAGLGIGIVASVSKISKAVESVTKPFESISELLGSVKGAVESYQKDLQASAIIKIAGAIAILAGALVILSFTDTDRLLGAAMALSVVSGVFLTGITALISAIKKGSEAPKALTVLANNLGSAFNQIAKGIKWKIIGSAMKDFGITIAIIAASIAGLALLYKYDSKSAVDAIKTIEKIAIAMGGATVAMSILGKLLGSGMESFQKAAIGMAAMSVSMLLIVTAMDKIMKMELPKDYKSRMLILTAIFGELAALTLVVGIASKIAGGESISSVPILALCGVLVVAVSSLKKLFGISLPTDYKTKLGIFAGIFAEMAILAIAIGAASRISGGNEMVSAPILAMCAFLYAATGALKKVMSIKFPLDWANRFLAFELMFITLGAVTAAVVLAGKSSEEGSSSAGTILAMVGFLTAAVSALAILSIMPASGILKGTIALGVILLSLAVTLKSVSKINNGDADKTVLAMAEVIGAITASLGVLSMIPWEGLAKSCLALGSILLSLAADFQAVSKITNEKAWVDILAMVGAMAAIVAALAILTAFPMEELIASAASLSAVLLSFSGSFYIISEAKKIKKKQLVSFLEASLVLVPITAALAVLANQPWEGLVAASVSLPLTLLAFAKTMEMISSRTGIKLEKIKNFLLASLVLVPITAGLAVLANQPWEGLVAASVSLSVTLLAYGEAMKIISSSKAISISQMGTFLAGSLAIVPIAAALVVLAGYDWVNLLAAGTALSATLLAYGATMAILSVSKTINLMQMAVFLAGALSLLPIAVALAMLAGYDWENLLASSVALSATMLSLSGALAILSVVGAAAVPALIGIAVLDALIADLIVVLVAISSLNLIPGIKDFLSGGGDILGKIGEAFGKLVSGLGVGLASGLPQIGASLSQFAANIMPFITTMQLFASSQAVKGCKEIVQMLALLTAMSFIQGVSTFLSVFTGGNSLKTFATELVSFGPAIALFANQVKDVKPEAVQGAASAAQLITKIYDGLPKRGGWMQVITGETMTLSQFAFELTMFGPSIARFGNQVKNINPEAVKGAASAAKLVAKIYEGLPKQGGWMQVIMGETMTLTQFSHELTRFGPSIARFGEQVKDVKPEAVQGAASAAKMIAKIYDLLPKQGGWMEVIMGGTMTLSDFGDELDDFGEPIVDFANDVKDVKPEAVQGAASAARIMALLAEDLPDTKNLGEKIFGGGTMTLTEFGNELVKFAPYINDFVEEVEGIDAGDVSGAMEAVKLITSTIDAITKSEMKTSLIAFGEQLKKFGQSLVTFYNQMVKTDFSKVSSITSNIKKLVEVATEAGEEGVSGFVTAINDGSGSITKALNKMINKAISTLRLSRSRFKTTGEQVGQKFIEGITNKISNSITALKNSASNLGKYYVQGFSLGINNNLDIAARAAANMARKADEAVAKELDEHSPSKVAEQKGEWYTEGFVKGISNKTSAVSKVASTLAKTTDELFITYIHRSSISLTKAMDTFYDSIIDGAKKIRLGFYTYLGQDAVTYSTVIQNRIDSMTSAIEAGHKNMDALQKDYDEKVARQKKEEEKQKAYEEEVQKQTELLKRQEELSKMSAKERKKRRQEEAKEAKISADAMERAYKKIYGNQKAVQEKFLDTNTEYYQKFLKVKISGNNKALYADKSLEEAEIDILKRITETLESYKEKFESTRESIMNEMNFFEGVDKEKQVKTKEQLIQNARDQLDLYQEYIKTQAQLRVKVGGTELYKYLETLGVDSTEQLKVINSMTEEELSNYVSLYDQKFQLSTIEAKNKLSEFQTEMETQLKDILGGVVKNIDLYEFMDQFDGKLTSVLGDKKTTKRFSKTLADFYSKNMSNSLIGVPIVGLLTSGVKESVIQEAINQTPEIAGKLQSWTVDVAKQTKPSAKKAGKSVAKAARLGAATETGNFYNTGAKMGKNLADGLQSQVGAVYAAAAALRAASAYAGSMASIGLSSGVSSGRLAVTRSFSSIAMSGVGAARSALGIHSPSTVMAKVGEYTILGFIGKILEFTAKVTAAAKKVGESAVKGMEDGSSNVSHLFGDLIIDPVITPVVDMSNVKRSIDDINQMFNDSIGTIRTGVQTTSASMNDRIAKQQLENTRTASVKNYYNFEQNNMSPKSLSAIDIYRSTKNQFAQFRERVEGV